jgi:hypothetical protein
VTAVLLVGSTEAVNCWVARGARVALVGEMDTDTVPDPLLPPHPASNTIRTVQLAKRKYFT